MPVYTHMYVLHCTEVLFSMHIYVCMCISTYINGSKDLSACAHSNTQYCTWSKIQMMLTSKTLIDIRLAAIPFPTRCTGARVALSRVRYLRTGTSILARVWWAGARSAHILSCAIDDVHLKHVPTSSWCIRGEGIHIELLTAFLCIHWANLFNSDLNELRGSFLGRGRRGVARNDLASSDLCLYGLEILHLHKHPCRLYTM